MEQIPVADFLFDADYKKPVAQMSVEEFRDVANSLQALAKHGRDVQKVYGEGLKRSSQGHCEMVEKLETFPIKEYPATEGRIRKALRLPKTYLASGINNETC